MDDNNRDTLPGWRFSCEDEPSAWDDKTTLFANDTDVVFMSKLDRHTVPIYVLSELLRRAGYILTRKS